MILEKQKEAIVISEGEVNESIGMSLDLDSAQILMQMLSKNLYSDSIGSTIRECASNALDSHRRIGVEEPIVVSLHKSGSGNYEFSVEDFGTGLDADDVRNIISKYGKSTKRNSNTELGMMGLGFKAPLAYSSSFYFTCRKDGMERKYMMYEGEELNTIDLLYESVTDQRNGVKVTVPVNYYDRNSFFRKIRSQLAYFESVYFDVVVDGVKMANDHVIYRGDDYQFSEMIDDSSLHLCLDNVYYPLDFDKLGIDRINFPVALKFSMTDGIFPTPNRESVRYNADVKKIILEKIKKVANYFTGKFNETEVEYDSLVKIHEFVKDNSRMINVGNSRYDLTRLAEHSDNILNTPRLKGVKIIDPIELVKRNDVFVEYTVRYIIDRRKIKEQKHWSNSVGLNTITQYPHALFENTLTGNKKLFMKEYYYEANFKNVKLVRKSSSLKLFSERGSSGSSYYRMLDLKNIPREDWREAIVEYQTAIKNVLDEVFLTPIDQIEIPKKWLDNKRAITSMKTQRNLRREREKGDIIAKVPVKMERYSADKTYKFVTETWKISDIKNTAALTIYGSDDQRDQMDQLCVIAGTGSKKIRPICLSNREVKISDSLEIHNLISFEKFMTGKNKPFKRLITAFLIEELRLQYRSVFDKREKVGRFSSDLESKLSRLDNYRSKHFITSGNHKLYAAMLEVAVSKKLFDMKIYDEYLHVKNVLEKYDFLNVLFKHVDYYDSENNDQLMKITIDLLRFNKFRMNLDKYNLKLNEDEPVIEEEIEEEELEF